MELLLRVRQRSVGGIMMNFVVWGARRVEVVVDVWAGAATTEAKVVGRVAAVEGA